MTYQDEIREWQSRRLKKLLNEDGWTTLVGLYWLEPGENSFGRAADNRIVLDYPSLPEQIGTFQVAGREVRFMAEEDLGSRI